MPLRSMPMHCDMVMIAHIVSRKLDVSTLSYNIISGLLRHDLQFKGVVITDDMQMKAIAHYYGLATVLTAGLCT